MKDSSVAPAGLFSPARQRRLLDALIDRFEVCERQRQELIDRHAVQRDEEEQVFQSDRGRVTQDCRRRRREMLSRWDSEEEKLFARYEDDTIQTRTELNRLASRYRKMASEGKAAIDRKFEARRDAVVQEYELRRHLPGEQSKKEHEQITASLAPLGQELTAARKLVVSRLDGLPSVVAEEPLVESPPTSISETVECIQKLSRDCKDLIEELNRGIAAKLVDSIYLFAIVLGLVVAWTIGVVVVSPASFWTFILSGVVALVVAGLVVYASLLLPLRSKTRRVYPQIERTAMAADETANIGRKLSTELAREASNELLAHRDKQIKDAEVWRAEQIEELTACLAKEQAAAKKELDDRLASLGNEFREIHGRVSGELHEQAERVAGAITDELAQTDRALHEKRESNARLRHDELVKVTNRMRIGVNAGLERIAAARESSVERFPVWDDVIRLPHTSQAELDFVPLGSLRIAEPLHKTLAAGQAADRSGAQDVGSEVPIFTADEIPDEMPIALHRRLHSGLVVRAAPEQMDRANELVHQVLWRMLSGTAGGRAKLTLIDPVGRGQNFTSFMALADHDPTLVSHRVWTTENQIEERLGEIAQHAEDVLQASLRDQFQRVEDYNRIAGSMAEPYRAVAAIGLPEGLTRGAYKHLKALIESGVRCGVFVLLVVDETQPWSSEMPLPRDHRLLELAVDGDGQWSMRHDGLETLRFVPEENVPSDRRAGLAEKIGRAATEAAKVEVPLESLLDQEAGGAGSTDDGIEITIGSQGGRRTLALQLGEGVRQHVLIAGKTGSGKSTLLHAIITSGAYRYTPDQLQYYLLDFKKGVEFKAYADAGLPHARVIGIESEREFGRSVLQRLDDELQSRGELFRSVSAQELSEYRSASGKSLPRIILVIDEFQELFVRDDRVAADCAMLLDRLVRQGRSFGIHVILSSQSLAGAYSLPRATLGQMAVRIAMHCSESDAALILADDNTAARLINRPGEAIYNDAGGLVEGNQPFQVAWLANDRHQAMLADASTRDQGFVSELPPPVIFEGNRPGKWSPALAAAAIGDTATTNEELHGLLGEAVEIGPPVGLQLSRNAGRNVLMIPSVDARAGLLTSMLSGFAKSNPELEVIYFNGNRPSESQSLYPWLEAAGIKATEVGPRDGEKEMTRLVELVKERGDEAENVHPIVFVIDPLDRFRDFRHDDAYTFSLDAQAGAMSGGQAMREVLKDGPPANVFGILVCGGAEIVSRWLPRSSQHDVELRVLGRLNASDSSLLIDSPMASELSAATMLLYDEPAGRISKFRQVDQPDHADVTEWLS